MPKRRDFFVRFATLGVALSAIAPAQESPVPEPEPAKQAGGIA